MDKRTRSYIPVWKCLDCGEEVTVGCVYCDCGNCYGHNNSEPGYDRWGVPLGCSTCIAKGSPTCDDCRGREDFDRKLQEEVRIAKFTQQVRNGEFD